MTWLAAWFLVAGGMGVLATIAAHMLSRHRPLRALLPTARFVPTARPVSATRVARPSDLLLLALRAVAVFSLGAAFARPVVLPQRGSIARVLLVDRSYDVADIGQAAAAARIARPGDALVFFDSAAAPALDGAAATAALGTLSSSSVRGSISAALAAGIEAGSRLRARADSIEMILISPVTAAELDGASRALRAAWPGRVRLVRVAARAEKAPASAILSATPDDPFAPTFALAGLASGDETAGVRVVRTVPTAADSQWARGTDRTLVLWPRDGLLPGWMRRPAGDSIAGVIADGNAAVARFIRTSLPPVGRVVARWSDGEPAATERDLDGGCVRHVAIPIAATGDLALRSSMQMLARAMTSACSLPGDDLVSASIAEHELGWLSGEGPLAASRSLARLASPVVAETPLVPWLIGASLVLLGVEMLLRDRWRRRKVA